MGAVASWAVLAPLAGCRRKHVPVDAVPELPYPSCLDGGVDERGVSLAEGKLRSGPISTEQNVVERFELRKTSCGYVYTARQEWSLAAADVEIHYDASLEPVWAWKRMTLPASTRPDGNADVRRYELRAGGVFIKRRAGSGEVTLEKLLPGGRMPAPEGSRVGAVVAPGRGSITPWLRRARLPVGGRTNDLVLDFRNLVEALEVGTLERQPDMAVSELGTVRVYTFFGRETVFADEHDTVIGDLAGMRPADRVTTPEPSALPTFGGPDPVHTP